MSAYETGPKAAAMYLDSIAQTSDRILAEDIGYFGYFCRMAVIDRDGLVTPQAIPYNKSLLYSQFVDSVNANWVFLDTNYPSSPQIITSPAFQQNYVLLDGITGKSTHQLFRRMRN